MGMFGAIYMITLEGVGWGLYIPSILSIHTNIPIHTIHTTRLRNARARENKFDLWFLLGFYGTYTLRLSGQSQVFPP